MSQISWSIRNNEALLLMEHQEGNEASICLAGAQGLQSVGLSSVQTGMDNVRNMTGSPIAGIDPHELLDVRQLNYGARAPASARSLFTISLYSMQPVHLIPTKQPVRLIHSMQPVHFTYSMQPTLFIHSMQPVLLDSQHAACPVHGHCPGRVWPVAPAPGRCFHMRHVNKVALLQTSTT